MKIFCLLVLTSFFSLTAVSIAAKAKEQKKAPALAEQIQGQWVLSGTPDKIKPAPKAGGRIKTISGKTWQIVQKDAKTGKVIFRHGGTFTLTGNKYVEKVEFANESTKALIGKVFTFKISVNKEGILINQGQGNPWTEAWRPIKE